MKNADIGSGLSASVLVLNRFYMAVHVVSARRAFCLLFRDLAEVINVEDGQYANYDFESWQLVCEMRVDQKHASEDWVQGFKGAEGWVFGARTNSVRESDLFCRCATELRGSWATRRLSTVATLALVSVL